MIWIDSETCETTASCSVPTHVVTKCLPRMCVRSSVVAVESASLAHLFGNKVLQPSEESHLCLHQAAWLQM